MTSPSALAVAFITVALLACAKEIPEPGGEVIDYQSPKNLVSHIFWAARTGNTGKLATLCLPDEAGNEAVRRVCGVVRGHGEWSSFQSNFAKGKLNGEPRVSGDTAVLKFLFGPDGAMPETMKLVRRDGRWYLESF